MNAEMIDVNVKNLCSRKLLELCATAEVNTPALLAIVEELQQRRHYLDKLSSLDTLQASHGFAQH